MTTRNLKWMLKIIDRLLVLEIGDPQKLMSIKTTLQKSKTITEEDDLYIYEKIKDLKKIEIVPEPTTTTSISTGKIIGIAVLAIIVIGGLYVWSTEISPEIQRINELNKRIEEQNEQIRRDRAFIGGGYNCETSPDGGVTVCD